MKLITLNVWGGKHTPELIAFLKQRQDIDIFCFQEVYHDAKEKEDKRWVNIRNMNLLDDMRVVMSGYEVLYHPHWGDFWGLTMFIKEGIEIIDSGEVYVHQEKGYNYDLEVLGHTAKNLQYATLATPEGERTIINFHGLYTGQDKEDSDERLIQSQNIVAFLRTLTSPYILCGDFNLNPETKSLAMLEDHGMRNLIKEFGVNSTRTGLYKKEGKYADYILVSGGIDALDFSVLPDVVSDHAPLYLEFS